MHSKTKKEQSPIKTKKIRKIKKIMCIRKQHASAGASPSALACCFCRYGIPQRTSKIAASGCALLAMTNLMGFLVKTDGVCRGRAGWFCRGETGCFCCYGIPRRYLKDCRVASLLAMTSLMGFLGKTDEVCRGGAGWLCRGETGYFCRSGIPRRTLKIAASLRSSQ